MSCDTPPAPLPELPDDAVREILLRIPPDRPECLVRASLASRSWRRVVSDRVFCRRYRDFHGAPPMLGFLCNDLDARFSLVSRFVPAASFRPRRPDRGSWVALDARHGRALFYDPTSNDGAFLLWDPVTDWQRRVPKPRRLRLNGFTAAVLCGAAAADGCDHRGCHGRERPSLVALVGTTNDGFTHACLYSTHTGAWSDTTSIEHGAAELGLRSSVLARGALHFIYEPSTRILRYDLVRRELSVIDRPNACGSNIVLTAAEDGGALGFAGARESSIHLWSREADAANGTMAWAQRGVLQLQKLLPPRALLTRPNVIGFAEGAGVIVVGTDDEIFTVELKSGRVKKVSRRGTARYVIPYTSFYTLDHAKGIMPLR